MKKKFYIVFIIINIYIFLYNFVSADLNTTQTWYYQENFLNTDISNKYYINSWKTLNFPKNIDIKSVNINLYVSDNKNKNHDNNRKFLDKIKEKILSKWYFPIIYNYLYSNIRDEVKIQHNQKYIIHNPDSHIKSIRIEWKPTENSYKTWLFSFNKCMDNNFLYFHSSKWFFKNIELENTLFQKTYFIQKIPQKIMCWNDNTLIKNNAYIISPYYYTYVSLQPYETKEINFNYSSYLDIWSHWKTGISYSKLKNTNIESKITLHLPDEYSLEEFQNNLLEYTTNLKNDVKWWILKD